MVFPNIIYWATIWGTLRFLIINSFYNELFHEKSSIIFQLILLPNGTSYPGRLPTVETSKIQLYLLETFQCSNCFVPISSINCPFFFFGGGGNGPFPISKKYGS